ncbi:chromo (CHRromatin organization MOdifier) domain-containing protein [Ditylenchus destructor]|nr:chromo (CHRromatin organization MOdifier) domain-containing protein [Ditylenchus destructor]
MATNGDVEAASEITGHLQKDDRMAPAASPEPEVEEQSSDEGSEIYEVERILDMKMVRNKRKFLIRWKGYGEDEDSWEPQENLDGANEIVATYLKELDNKPKTPKAKATPKSSGRSSKRSQSTFRPEKDEKEEESDEESDKSDDEFQEEPSKKKSKKGPHTPKKTDSKDSSTKTQLEKAVDRRKNLSSNLRWIAESSDESDQDDVVEVEEQTNKTPDIHPDSSTDLKATETNKTVTDSQESSGSLKLKITVNNDNPALENGAENGKSVDEEVKTKKNKKTKKQNRDESPQKPSETTKSTVCFNGMYMDDRDKTIRYVGINQKTKEVQNYTLAEAYMADGWSLVRFFSNKVSFVPSGETTISVDGKK